VRVVGGWLREILAILFLLEILGELEISLNIGLKGNLIFSELERGFLRQPKKSEVTSKKSNLGGAEEPQHRKAEPFKPC